VRILQRKVKTPPRIPDPERMILALLVDKFSQSTKDTRQRLHQVMLIFKSNIVLRWHRELVRRKWTFSRKAKPGRPTISSELEAIILRLANENPRWGYGKIQGELVKLSFKVSQQTVRNILNRHGIQPAQVRNGSIGWHHLMAHFKEQILACDFFTVETIWLQTISVLFFIELGSRRVHFTGVTTNPDQIWVTQQARQLVWDLSDRDKPLQFLIYDKAATLVVTHLPVSKWHIVSPTLLSPI
jgi:putative transposase